MWWCGGVVTRYAGGFVGTDKILHYDNGYIAI